VRRIAAWLLAGTLLLGASTAQAALQLRLKTEGLSPAQQQASQALLDEAMHALPPRFIEQLDRTHRRRLDRQDARKRLRPGFTGVGTGPQPAT